MPQVKTAMNDWVLLCYSVEQSRKQRTSAIKAECCSKPAVAAACSLQHAVLLEKASRRIGTKGYGSVEQLNKNALMHDKEPELPCICHISYTCSATSNNFAVLNDLQHLLDCGVQPFCSHAVDPRNEYGQSMIDTALQADSSDSSEFQKQPQTHRLKPNSDCCWEQSSECFHAKPGTCQLFLPQNESGREANAWQLSMTETSSSVIQSIHFLKLLNGGSCTRPRRQTLQASAIQHPQHR